MVLPKARCLPNGALYNSARCNPYHHRPCEIASAPSKATCLGLCTSLTHGYPVLERGDKRGIGATCMAAVPVGLRAAIEGGRCGFGPCLQFRAPSIPNNNPTPAAISIAVRGL